MKEEALCSGSLAGQKGTFGQFAYRSWRLLRDPAPRSLATICSFGYGANASPFMNRGTGSLAMT